MHKTVIGIVSLTVTLGTVINGYSENIKYLKRIEKENSSLDRTVAYLGEYKHAKATIRNQVRVLPVTKEKPEKDALYEWSTGEPVTNFIGKASKIIAPVQTLCWLRYDAENLYVIFKCDEPHMKKLTYSKIKNDDTLWEFDDVEFFIDTNNDKSTYYQFGVDVKGNRFDAKCKRPEIFFDIKWSIPWNVRTLKGQDCWYAEMSIPLKKINLVPQKGVSFRISLNRIRYAGGTLTPSGWPYGRFNEPEQFGIAIFE